MLVFLLTTFEEGSGKVLLRVAETHHMSLCIQAMQIKYGDRK
jgi:hypothetical protein